jgi:hypothetical protein
VEFEPPPSGAERSALRPTHTQRETKEPAARSNAAAAEPGTRRQQVVVPLAAECVCVMRGGSLLQALQIRRVLQRLGDGLAAHLAQTVVEQAASKRKRAIKAHADISAQTQREE